MESQSFEFAGIKSKLTSKGLIRKPALLKMLRSGRVKLITRDKTTDDSMWDSDCKGERGIERCPLELADDIAKCGSGWWSLPEKDGSVTIGCHHFLSFKLVSGSPSASSEAIESEAHETIQRRIRESEAARKVAAAKATQEAEAIAEVLESLCPKAQAWKEAQCLRASGAEFH